MKDQEKFLYKSESEKEEISVKEKKSEKKFSKG